MIRKWRRWEAGRLKRWKDRDVSLFTLFFTSVFNFNNVYFCASDYVNPIIPAVCRQMWLAAVIKIKHFSVPLWLADKRLMEIMLLNHGSVLPRSAVSVTVGPHHSTPKSPSFPRLVFPIAAHYPIFSASAAECPLYMRDISRKYIGNILEIFCNCKCNMLILVGKFSAGGSQTMVGRPLMVR